MKIAIGRRFLQVARTLKRYHVLSLLISINPSQRAWAKWAKRLWSDKRHLSHAQQAQHLRTALESLGPIFIKLGQMLSTRPDLFPPIYIEELSHLQERVTPIDTDIIHAVFEQETGQTIEQVFSEFNEIPVAAASLAQVHRARIRDGEWAGREVAIKVLRPDIDDLIATDIECMYVLARWLEKNHPDGKRLHPVEVVAQLEQHLRQELDLQYEAANASHLRHNFEHSNLVFIPEISWQYTTRRVMVQEWIDGVPSSDIETIDRLGIDRKRLARDGVEVFYTQVFRDGFFHADMHPGNIYVGTQGVMKGHYIALDCGIIGTLSDEDKHYLAINLLACFKRDYRLVAQMHIEAGWVPPDTPLESLASAIRVCCEPNVGKPISEISLGILLMRLFEVSRQFNVEIQPQLVLLQKTILNVEGMGLMLDDQLDLWQVSRPFFENWMKKHLGLRSLFRQTAREWPSIARLLPTAPRQFMKLLEGREQQALLSQLSEQNQHIKHLQQRQSKLIWLNVLVLIVVLIAVLERF